MLSRGKAAGPPDDLALTGKRHERLAVKVSSCLELRRLRLDVTGQREIARYSVYRLQQRFIDRLVCYDLEVEFVPPHG